MIHPFPSLLPRLGLFLIGIIAVIGPVRSHYPQGTLFDIQQQPWRSLPIADISFHPTINAKGAVILIPQYHLDPSQPDPSSPANDRAYQVQREIYQVLPAIIAKTNIKNIFIEGQKQGPVPATSLSATARKKKHLARAATLSHPLNDRASRHLFLEGAAKVLAVDRPDIRLYGAETEHTLKASRKIITDYLRAKDRLAQLQAATPATDPPQPVSIASLINHQSTGDSSALAQTNPYHHVTNPQQLERRLRHIKKDISATVLERRNQETARNLDSILTQNNATAAILQFGASHTDGMVRALQQQGYHVTVVTPRSAADHNH